MRLFFNKFTYLVIFIIFFLILIFFWYIPNANSAKNVVVDFDFKYYDVICKGKLPNYDELIKDPSFLNQISYRDKYYSLLHKKSNNKFPGLGIGNSWYQTLILPDTCIIKSKSWVSKPSDPKPGLKYNRWTLLKKYNGQWAIENDIISSGKISISELFDKNKVLQRAKEYENKYNKLLKESNN